MDDRLRETVRRAQGSRFVEVIVAPEPYATTGWNINLDPKSIYAWGKEDNDRYSIYYGKYRGYVGQSDFEKLGL